MAYALLSISKDIKPLDVMQILLLFSHTTSEPLQGPHFIWTALPLLSIGSSAPDPIVLDLPIS